LHFLLKSYFFLFLRKKKEIKCERNNGEDGKKELNVVLKCISHCGIISKIKVLHLKINVYMKNIALFTH